MRASSVTTRRDSAPFGCVLITCVNGERPRFQLSHFPARPRLELTSAPIAWQLAQQFAARDHVDVWFTSDGVTFTPAPPEPPPSYR
jgi:hypothetical protein